MNNRMDKILFVDDDASLLQQLQRRLQKHFAIDTAPGGQKGLDTMKAKGPYAVIVTGLHMPVMNGFQFVEKAKQIAPASVFIMLTAHAKLDESIKALNEGRIFRLLTKPCKLNVLEKTLQDGIELFHRNQMARIPAPEAPYRKKILIVDDDPEILSIFSSAVNATGQFDVLTAESGKIAMELLNFIKINITVVDKSMPETDGLRLLSEIRRQDANMILFLMAWNTADDLKGTVPDINLSGIFEKPLDMPAVLSDIQSTLQSGPTGAIKGFSTVVFLQMIEMEEKTCTLQVRSGNRTGFLYFKKGWLIAAQTGKLKNEEAAYEIINWKDAAIEIDHEDRDRVPEINRPLMHILVEAVRRKDETEIKI